MITELRSEISPDSVTIEITQGKIDRPGRYGRDWVFSAGCCAPEVEDLAWRCVDGKTPVFNVEAIFAD
jgi:hypothetical protein